MQFLLSTSPRTFLCINTMDHFFWWGKVLRRSPASHLTWELPSGGPHTWGWSQQIIRLHLAPEVSLILQLLQGSITRPHQIALKLCSVIWLMWTNQTSLSVLRMSLSDLFRVRNNYSTPFWPTFFLMLRLIISHTKHAIHIYQFVSFFLAAMISSFHYIVFKYCL